MQQADRERKIAALRRLAADAAASEHERAAARAAIARLEHGRAATVEAKPAMRFRFEIPDDDSWLSGCSASVLYELFKAGILSAEQVRQAMFANAAQRCAGAAKPG